jgi:hypothetical protein
MPVSPKTWHKCFDGPRYPEPPRKAKPIVVLTSMVPTLKKRTKSQLTSKAKTRPKTTQASKSKVSKMPPTTSMVPSPKRKRDVSPKALTSHIATNLKEQSPKVQSLKEQGLKVPKATPIPQEPLWSIYDSSVPQSKQPFNPGTHLETI